MKSDIGLYFRFLNIPVQIHPTFWLLILFFTGFYLDPSIESMIVGVVFAFSLLVHEFGHALTARCFGAQPTIKLWALGGEAQYNGRGITPFQNFIIVLNGPLFECLLIVVSYALLELDFVHNQYYLLYFLTVTMRLNILWCLLNLIPLQPLDGGQLTLYVLEKLFGDRGYKISLYIGLFCSVILIPYLFYEGLYFFGTLLFLYGMQNLQLLRGLWSSGRESNYTTLVRGIEAMNCRDTVKAKSAFKKLLKTKDLQIKHSAIEALAKIYYYENDPQKSYHLLLKSDHQLLREGKCLLCKLAFEYKNYELIEKYSRDIYAIESSFEIALLNSQAFASLQKPTLSGAWLVTASQFGEDYRIKAKDILSLPIYDLVRDHESFKQYAGTIAI